MHIGIDGLPLSKPRTGVGHYTFELARSLALMSPVEEIELISPEPFLGLGSPEAPLPKNLKSVQVQVGPISRHWWTLGLPRYLRRNPANIFHGTNYDVPLQRNCPTVLTIHDLSSYLYAETQLSRAARRARYRLPIMARRATMIVTPSIAVREEVCNLLKVDPNKVVAVHHAPRPRFQPLKLEQTTETRKRLGVEDNFLLFVGTIEPRKNLVRLAQAFERVLETTAERPQLVIAGGEGWLTEDFFKHAGESRFSDRLRWTGYLTDEDLCALYSSCRLFIYPSLYEGFGFPPLEAMACGAPVITSRIASIMEVVGNSAHLVSPTNVDELAQSMIALLKNPNEIMRLSAAGLKRASEFSWKRTARLTYDVYLEAIKKHNVLRRGRSQTQ